jgi:hypothetical protein
MTADAIRARYGIQHRCLVQTPWGVAQHVETLAPGVFFVSTARHGGVKLDAKNNRRIPKPFRCRRGWYEKDLDWAIAVNFIPEAFPSPVTKHNAIRILKDFHWREWEAFTGEELGPVDSMGKREALFRQRHRADFIVTRAWGDWNETVPTGMVGVVATLGGRLRGTEAIQGKEKGKEKGDIPISWRGLGNLGSLPLMIRD